MRNNYALDFKDKYSFLEEYGFVFSNDPFNPNRPCYKNLHGEIILWVQHDSGSFGLRREIYVQINGWKKTIDVVSEYKKYINKNVLFKPLEKMFEELFIFMFETKGEFYGLKIYKIRSNKKSDANFASFDAYYNPSDEKRKSIIVIIFSIIILVAYLLSIVLLIVINEYAISYQDVLFMKNIIYISIIICSFVILLFTFKVTNIITKLLLMGCPIVIYISLFNFSKRTHYLVVYISLIVCIIYFLYYLFRFLIKKDENLSINSILPLIWPLAIAFVKALNLSEYVFFLDLEIGPFAIVGLIAGVITVILYLILKKDKSDKKKVIEGIFVSLFVPLLLVIMIPYFSILNINYTLDSSDGIIKEYRILDKEIRHGSGRYSSDSHYLYIFINGEIEDIKVDSATYNEYIVGEKIKLAYYEGFLEISYYELIV